MKIMGNASKARSAICKIIVDNDRRRNEKNNDIEQRIERVSVHTSLLTGIM